MKLHNKYFQDLYRNFNERKIDLVISKMTDEIKWANGMDGGFVYGHKGVRDYWISQFAQVSSKVTPMEIEAENNVVKIKVHQVVHDINGKLLADEIVYHYFHLNHNKIAEFNIGQK
jgi:hypothetical protein